MIWFLVLFSNIIIALPPIVIDNGSDTIKAGFARESEPRAVFASVLGRAHQASATLKSVYVGREAQLFARSNAAWCATGAQWRRSGTHTFYNELRVAPE
jgi:hypothetical protein